LNPESSNITPAGVDYPLRPGGIISHTQAFSNRYFCNIFTPALTLVRSGMVELHPVQCYCSQGLMETVFSLVAKRRIEVDIKQSIGRGDNVCEFIVSL